MGVQEEDGNMSVIIEKNSPVPLKQMQQYTNSYDNSTSIAVSVYEGEDLIAAKNYLLNEFSLEGLPNVAKGKAVIQVTFHVDINGILNVSAIEKSSGVSKSVRLTSMAGFEKGEIDKMSKEIEKYRLESSQKREAKDAQDNLYSYCTNMKATFNETGNKVKITKTEREMVLNACNEVINQIDNSGTLDKKEKCEQKIIELSENPVNSKLCGKIDGAQGGIDIEQSSHDDNSNNGKIKTDDDKIKTDAVLE